MRAVAACLPRCCCHKRRPALSPVLPRRSQMLCAGSLLFGSRLQPIVSRRLGPTCNTMQVHKDRVLTRSKQRSQVMALLRQTWKEACPLMMTYNARWTLGSLHIGVPWRAQIRSMSCERGVHRVTGFLGRSQVSCVRQLAPHGLLVTDTFPHLAFLKACIFAIVSSNALPC